MVPAPIARRAGGRAENEPLPRITSELFAWPNVPSFSVASNGPNAWSAGSWPLAPRVQRPTR